MIYTREFNMQPQIDLEGVRNYLSQKAIATLNLVKILISNEYDTIISAGTPLQSNPHTLGNKNAGIGTSKKEKQRQSKKKRQEQKKQKLNEKKQK